MEFLELLTVEPQMELREKFSSGEIRTPSGVPVETSGATPDESLVETSSGTSRVISGGATRGIPGETLLNIPS